MHGHLCCCIVNYLSRLYCSPAVLSSYFLKHSGIQLFSSFYGDYTLVAYVTYSGMNMWEVVGPIRDGQQWSESEWKKVIREQVHEFGCNK